MTTVTLIQESHVCGADAENEAMMSYRAALQTSLDAPSAGHPIEQYGKERFSLAQARQEVGMCIVIVLVWLRDKWNT